MTTVTVGSSDVAAILGLSRWGSPQESWARLVGLVPRYTESDTNSQARGRILEPALLRYWQEQNGFDGMVEGPPIGAQPMVAADGWRHARPDGLGGFVTKEPPVRLLSITDGEAKSTRSWEDWGEAGTGDVPIYYACQVHWQMPIIEEIFQVPVTHADIIAYCTLTDEVRIFPVDRDRDLEEKLQASVKRWMEAHVWCDPVVPPGPPTMALVQALFPQAKDKQLVQPLPEHYDARDTMLRLRAEVAERLDLFDAIKAKLCDHIGEHGGIHEICLWSNRKGRPMVDGKRLKADHPEIYKSYLKTGKPGRTFTIKKPKR